MRHFHAVALGVIVLAGACRARPGETTGPCLQQQLSGYSAELRATLDEWKDAHDVSEASRGSASVYAAERLQEIRRKFQALSPPQCADVLHARILAAMNAEIAVVLGTVRAGENIHALLDVQRKDAEKIELWNQVVVLLAAAYSPEPPAKSNR